MVKLEISPQKTEFGRKTGSEKAYIVELVFLPQLYTNCFTEFISAMDNNGNVCYLQFLFKTRYIFRRRCLKNRLCEDLYQVALVCLRQFYANCSRHHFCHG
jgi:hypothetical protein